MTPEFEEWLHRLKDQLAKRKILASLNRISKSGIIQGDWKALQQGIFELRFHVGPGYRLYYKTTGHRLIVLLIGGSKKTQQRDVDRALVIAANLEPGS